MDDHPTTSTRVIELPHRLSADSDERPDRNDAAGQSRPQTTTGRGQPDASAPGEAALMALVRLLARQTAEEDFNSRSRGHEQQHEDAPR